MSKAHGYLLPTIVRWLKQAGARVVLDLGCGNGAVAAALAAEGYEMTGLDVSESGIAIAARSYPGIPFIQADLSAPLPAPLRERFDTVLAVEVVEHLLLPRCLFERAREALCPNGAFIVTTPYHGFWKNVALALTNQLDDHWHPLRDYGHVKFFSRATLSRLFAEQGLPIRRFKRVGRIAPLAKSMIAQGTYAP